MGTVLMPLAWTYSRMAVPARVAWPNSPRDTDVPKPVIVMAVVAQKSLYLASNCCYVGRVAHPWCQRALTSGKYKSLKT